MRGGLARQPWNLESEDSQIVQKREPVHLPPTASAARGSSERERSSHR